MRETERRARLVDHLRADGRASVADLAIDLGVTPSTIRRDLQRLAREGRLVRTYGGAALSPGATVSGRGDPNLEAKRTIARAAAAHVADDTTIAIGSGTTALAFAREVAGRRLTVITNALDVANVLLDRDGIELIVLGGVVRPRMHSMLGHLAELSSQELRADTLFMGIGAISPEQGLMNDSVPEILTDRALRRMSRSVVVLADASKFEQVAPGYVFGLDEVDLVITDAGAPAPTLAALRKQGVEVEVAVGPDEDATAATARRTGPRAGRDRSRAMIDGVVPTEIREGPAAIRATVESARDDAREIAGALADGRRPARPRDRQRHQLPLEPRGGHAVSPSRRSGRPGRDPDDGRRVPRLPARARTARRRRRDLVVGRVQGRHRGRRGRPRPDPDGGHRPRAGIDADEGRVRHRPVGRRPLGRAGHDEDVLGDPRRDRAAAPRAPRREPRQPPGRRDPRSPRTPRRRRSPPPSRWSSRSPRRSRTRGICSSPAAASATRPRSRRRSSSRRWRSSTPRARRSGR